MRGNKYLFWLVLIIGIVALAGGAFAISVFYETGSNGMFSRSFCIRNECVELFAKEFSASLKILTVTGALIGGLVTFGGILVALFSYLGDAKSAALSNHISHLAIFSSHIYTEIDKRDRLGKESFDVIKWYNCIYDASRQGDLSVSKSYLDFMRSLENVVKKSNGLVGWEEEGGYRYKAHQQSLKELMSKIGVTLCFMPRLDFHEMEGQLFDLVKTVNGSFCQSHDLVVLPDRKYL